MKRNIIHLNGKLYDSETGKIVSPKSAQPAAKSTATTTKQVKTVKAKSIDGFGGTTSRATIAKATQKPKITPPSHTSSVHRSLQPASMHPQHATTLNRSFVKKPTKKSQPAAQSTAVTSPRANQAHDATPSIKPAPARSPQITRFSDSNHVRSAATPKMSDVAPAKSPAKNANPAKAPSKSTSASTKDALIANAFSNIDKQKSETKPAKKSRVRHHLKRHRKLAGVFAGSIAVILIATYVVYLNVPNMAIKYAASRAGFDAVLPHYAPSGYSFNGPIAHKPGQVTISFKSNSDNRKYSVVEQPSDWDSEAVYDYYVSKHSDQPPYTIQDSGLTIYVFGDNNAAWVNAGKFFAISGENAQLSTQQLQNIATSL